MLRGPQIRIEGCVREINLLSFRKIEPRLSGRQDSSLFIILGDSGGKFNIWKVIVSVIVTKKFILTSV